MIKKIIDKFFFSKNNKTQIYDTVEIIDNSKEFVLSESSILKQKNLNFDNIFDKSFVDMPDSEPRIKLPIKKVGITQRPHYVKIYDPFEDNKKIEILVDLKIFIPLRANKRGLHMSRLERVLVKFKDNVFKDLSEYSEAIIKELAATQEKNKGEIVVEGIYEKDTYKNQSGRKGHEILNLYSTSILKDDKVKNIIGLGVQFMNACPCPQRWAIRKFYQHLKNLGYQENDIYQILEQIPFESHTNRGSVKIYLENKENRINYRDIYQILDNSVTIVRELLSGNDEHLFIRESHEKELFCEDVVRVVAFNLYKYLIDLNIKDKDMKVKIETEVDESIHFHNLYAKVSCTLKDLEKMLRKYNENI